MAAAGVSGVDRAAIQHFLPTQPTQVAVDESVEAAALDGRDAFAPPEGPGSTPDASLPPPAVAPTPSVLAAPENGLGPMGRAKRARTYKALLPGDDEVKRMDEGYGAGGASVQRADMGPVLLSDREMMKKTLLRGESTIFGNDVCDSIRLVPKVDARAGRLGADVQDGAKGKSQPRQSLKMAHWIAVMQAGLEQERIGVFDAAKGNPDRHGARVHLHLPAEDDPEATTEYHNRLMRLCCLGFTSLMEAVAKKGEKTARKPRKAAPARGSAAPEPGSVVPALGSPVVIAHVHEGGAGGNAGLGGSAASGSAGAAAPDPEVVNPANVTRGPGEY